jgi:glycosyltransferase involved in cell wall biosynthesis
MDSLTIGVAIITFNGLKYLPQQLESIATQTRSVHHIVVSDDRSTDGTWEFLQEWAQQSSIRVTLIRNETQLGLRANFEQSVAAVEADIIFTSDQDDVWVPDRVALLTQVFAQHPNVLLVHTDAILVDAAGRDMGKRLLGELELSGAERNAIHSGDAFAVYCRRSVVTGATVAIRSTLVPIARPFVANLYHDAWLALLAAAAGEVRLLEAPTIHYRQHGNNLVGVKKINPWMKLRHIQWQMKGPAQLDVEIDNNIASHRVLYERMAAHAGMSPSSLAVAAQSLAFYRGRAALPKNALPRLAIVLRHLFAGHYARFSYAPWADTIRDIFRK